LFDLQVNGYAGIDFNNEAITPEALDHALAAMLRAGVCHCLPTLITAPEPILAGRLKALDRAVRASRLGAQMVPGYHLEGPFLNPAPGFAGCHPAGAMPPPDPLLLDRVRAQAQLPIILLTVAPERGPGIVAAARARGIAVAIGHSAADYPAIQRAAADGATLSTHLGNALPQPMAKFNNPLIAQLAEDRLAASFIADGIHIPPHALAVLIRAKGLSRTVLVTDATAAAAAAPGTYRFAGMAIEAGADGMVRLPGTERLAGSALTLDQAVRNLVRWGIATPAEAIEAASANALSAAGMAAPRLPQSRVTWNAELTPREARFV
jgi:N-acetylglucosamine-6-phosphate deacetylase